MHTENYKMFILKSPRKKEFKNSNFLFPVNLAKEKKPMVANSHRVGRSTFLVNSHMLYTNNRKYINSIFFNVEIPKV